MCYLLLTALLLASLLPRPAAGQAIHSHLFVEPGKQFSLGGDQPEGFRVAAHDTGPVPVALRKRLRMGAVVERGNLAPGQRATLRFAPGSAALVRNASAQRAVLDLDIRGGHPGRMTYEPAGGN